MSNDTEAALNAALQEAEAVLCALYPGIQAAVLLGHEWGTKWVALTVEGKLCVLHNGHPTLICEVQPIALRVHAAQRLRHLKTELDKALAESAAGAALVTEELGLFTDELRKDRSR